MCDAGPADMRTGTTITFHPDPDIFHDATLEGDRLEARLRELAFLNPGLKIDYSDERSGKEEGFLYARGIVDFVKFLNHSREVLHSPLAIDTTAENIRVQAALQYTIEDHECVRCYANNACNKLGTHLTGFRAGLTRAIKSYARKKNLIGANSSPIGDDFRSGLTAVVNVRLFEPQFESQSKNCLCNPEVERIVARVVREAVASFVTENTSIARQIIRKVISAGKARLRKRK